MTAVPLVPGQAAPGGKQAGIGDMTPGVGAPATDNSAAASGVFSGVAAVPAQVGLVGQAEPATPIVNVWPPGTHPLPFTTGWKGRNPV